MRVYEQDGLIYSSDREYGKTKISHYNGYRYFWDDKALAADVESRFSVKLPGADCRIACRCGSQNDFSAYYGSYELILECKCGNKFSAYSG